MASCKKIYSLSAISFILLIPLFSCKQNQGGSKDQSNKSTDYKEIPVVFDLANIRERDTLVAIIDNSSTGYFIYKGQPMGYEYELLNLLAKELEVNLKLEITRDIEKAFQKLNNGEGDIIAHNLTITKERAKRVAFTRHHYTTKQVLVQRKPENWRKMKRHEIDEQLIRNPIDLIGKEVYVRKSSSYLSRLQNLSDEVGGDIIIVEDFDDVETEALIKKVAIGEIDYTVADDDVAMVNKTYYPNIDIKTAISFPQRIAWAVRKNSPELLNTVNAWIKNMQKKTQYYVIYNKYFKSPKASLKRVKSDYASFSGDKISPYDSLIKIAAEKLEWDWRLLAAQIFQESRFNPDVKSWAGATGLMQLLPETAVQFGADDIYDPQKSILAGTNYLKWLTDFWAEKIPDEPERIKFVLASYNVGQGHVLDAYRLAKKYGKDPAIWENTSYYILKKSKPKFYNDPVVTSGYCRGEEPVKYVRDIIRRFQQYKQLMDEPKVLDELSSQSTIGK